MLNRLKVGQKLMLGCGMLCLLAGLLAWIGYREIMMMREQLDAVPDMVSTRLLLNDWQGNSATNAARAAAILRSSDLSLADALAPEMKTTSDNVSAMESRIEALKMSEESKTAFQAVGEARKEYIAARENALKLKRERTSEARQAYDSIFFPAFATYDLAVQNFVDSLSTDYIRRFATAKDQSDRSLVWLAAFCGLFVVCAAALVAIMVRSITVPVRDAVHVADALAKGDLTRQIAPRGSDEIGALVRSLAAANAQLSVLVRGIQDAAAAISGGAGQISNGNNQLSQRTESQASSLEETASSMEELTSTVTHNADNAKTASQLVEGASQVAARGGAVVGEVVRTMQGISQSSRKIADITGIIDGIAFQTNILALNAAVEAARAGDQGRGFAVVASEVRSLAQRSATAAKEIKALIDESVGKVDTGAKLAEEAGKTMEQVVAAVRKVADITGDIRDASREQASGIQQVNQAITQMDQATQQNAALVEQLSAASASLQDQAQVLMQAVAQFTLAEAGPALHADAGLTTDHEPGSADAALPMADSRLALPAA